MADDYSFMKSGFENLVYEDEDPTENIASIVLVFMENAVKNAAIYTKHSNRTGITPEDIKRGLMLETFFIKQRPNMLEQCEEMKQTISKILEEDDDNDEKEEDNIIDEEEFKESECQCALCNCMNNIYTRWKDFTPQSTIEIIMYNHINRIV